jgi:hypothetical protein
MTEQAWLTCTEPGQMLEHVRRRLSARKQRLFAVACCRGVWDLLADPRSRAAVEVAERFADDLASARELRQAEQEAELAHRERWTTGVLKGYIGLAAKITAASRVLGVAVANLTLWIGQDGHRREPGRCAAVCSILRDIVGNPFRPVACEPAWQTPEAVAIARSMYDDRRFEDLPFLADALEDAGCTSADLLQHCRNAGAHVRGCWILDLVLGNE